jgi:hypothetical protein
LDSEIDARAPKSRTKHRHSASRYTKMEVSFKSFGRIAYYGLAEGSSNLPRAANVAWTGLRSSTRFMNAYKKIKF